MAKDEYLALLNRGVAAWNDLRGTSSEQTARFLDSKTVDLRGASLAGYDLSGVHFSMAWLENADLSGANLSRADLFRANLEGANLSNAILTGASLWEVDFSDANLSGTNLIRAQLGDAHFDNANLSGADLGEAFLAGAVFYGTDLTEANLTKAQIGYTGFYDMDLSQPASLAHVEHLTPSRIGASTLEITAASYPRVRDRQREIESFMRGTGLSDNHIQVFRNFIGHPIDFYSCFISYSHADARFARRLHAELQASGIRCWLDEHQMLPGDKLYDVIDRGIRVWDKVLLCCSKASLTSWWVDNEIDIAFEKEQRLSRERGRPTSVLIPLNLDNYLFSTEWQSGKAAQLRSRLAADFTGLNRSGRKFAAQLARVARSLRTDTR